MNCDFVFQWVISSIFERIMINKWESIEPAGVVIAQRHRSLKSDIPRSQCSPLRPSSGEGWRPLEGGNAVRLPDVAFVSIDDVALVQLTSVDDGTFGLTVVLLDTRVQSGVVVHPPGRTRLRLAPW